MSDERYELPAGWVWANLNKLIQELESGSRPKGGVRGIRQGVPSVGGEHLNQSGGFDFSAVRFVPEAFAASMNKGWIQPHDILIVKDGATTGKTSFVDDQFPYSKAVLNEHVFRLRAFSEVVDQRYLFRFLWGQVGQRMIAKAFRGTAQGGINQSFPQFVDVPLAPLSEQRRIATKIEALFEQSRTARQGLDRIPPLLKRFRQAVLAAAFRGDLTRDWRDQHPDIEPASALLDRIRAERLRRYHEEVKKARAEGRRPPRKPTNLEPKEIDTSDLHRIPASWKWVQLPFLGELSRGKSKHRPRNDPRLFGRPYPFIQTGDIARSAGRVTSYTQAYNKIGLAQSRLFPTGTVCITIAANIANSAILTFPACFPDSVVGFVPEPDCCDGEFVEYFMRTIRENLAQFAPATAQKNINLEILGQVAVPVPPIAEQREIVHQIGALFGMADAIEGAVEAARRRAENLEQSILARAFRGELVPQDPDDEPASTLLDRIRTEREKCSAVKKARAHRRRLNNRAG